MGSLGYKLKQILSEYGCEFVREAKGDHEMWRSPINGATFTVDNGMTSRHSANGTLKQAGIPKHF